MKKLALTLCTLASVCAFGSIAKADVGPQEDYRDEAPRRYSPRYEYREDDGCERRRVYIIEDDRPVVRIVYFDRAGRCFYPAGPRRVYIENYYTTYPRHYAHRHAYYGGYHDRPHFSASIGF